MADRAWFSARGADREETEVGSRVRGLIERNVDFVSRSVRRLGVPAADVEDATQQVFIVAARKLEKFDEDRERSYLFGIAVRVASDARRAARRRNKAHELFAIDFLSPPRLSPESQSIELQARRLLDEALNTLPERLRIVFVVCELEGMDRVAAASLLDIPPGTVASRMRKARILFQKAAARLRQVDRKGDSH
ncbi:MAG: sigma-70 family RNA polymerase sigma factor [Myxococcales bacterium]|nr:sigma-70 family RNA polymerase sigma factor [Myxococcales bacterium]